MLSVIMLNVVMLSVVAPEWVFIKLFTKILQMKFPAKTKLKILR